VPRVGVTDEKMKVAGLGCDNSCTYSNLLTIYDFLCPRKFNFNRYAPRGWCSG